jgi:hypothetical protein
MGTPMGDAEVTQIPGKVGADHLHALDGHREPLTDLVDEGDRVRDRVVRVDPEDPEAGRLVDRREAVVTEDRP